MKRIIFLILLTLSFNVFSEEQKFLKPFVSDYCTMYPEGTFGKPDQWKHCCLEHDLYFWAGGSQADRDQSDLGLKECVMKTGNVVQARLIYWGVRAGRLSPITFKKKVFGNGWIVKRPRIPLSAFETEQLILEVNAHENLSLELKRSFAAQLLSRLE